MYAKDVKYIVIHCTAGYGDVDSLKRYWRNVLGWKHVGYHFVIDRKGTIFQLSNLDNQVNGVKHFNHECIHISYIGGVRRDNYRIPEDTRTKAQKVGIMACIFRSLNFLKKNGKDIKRDLLILGHRDFSDDKNDNGIIDSWERIKACPSFDAIPEYKWIWQNKYNSEVILPKDR